MNSALGATAPWDLPPHRRPSGESRRCRGGGGRRQYFQGEWEQWWGEVVVIPELDLRGEAEGGPSVAWRPGALGRGPAGPCLLESSF